MDTEMDGENDLSFNFDSYPTLSKQGSSNIFQNDNYMTNQLNNNEPEQIDTCSSSVNLKN